MIKSYKDLEIYQKAYKLGLKAHTITLKYPEYERYELGSQIRRAALSIPLTIAEGYGKKGSEAEFKRFLNMALGSSNEMEVLLDMSKDMGYVDEGTHKELVEEYIVLRKQIYTLMSKWKKSDI